MADSPAGELARGCADEDAPGPADIPAGRVPPAGSGMPWEGLWLTAMASLPAELLAAGAPGPAGFAQGGPLDELAPGPVLATFAAEAADPGGPGGENAGLQGLPDDQLTGVLRAWRKLSSWAQANELAAAAEITSRRRGEAEGAGDRQAVIGQAGADEIAAALTLTGRAAQDEADRAIALHALPATEAALAEGRIDMPRALVLLTSLAGQDPDLARQVETQVIGQAPAQTSGQLRAAVNRALLAADPAAAERRRQHEERHAWIEQRPEPGGLTATLTGRLLPVAASVAAWNHLTGLARQLRTGGAPGTLDDLRVQAYLAVLSGHDPTSQDNATDGTGTGSPATSTADGTAKEHGTDGTGQPATGEDGMDGTGQPGTSQDDRADQADPAGQADRAGDAPADGSPAGGSPAGAGPAPPPQVPAGPAAAPAAPLTGRINLTLPLATLLGLADTPGDLGGFGPITGQTARQMATSALGAPAVRWCLTVTGETGQAVAHGCGTRPHATPGHGRPPAPPGRLGPEWRYTINLTALAGPECAHQRESSHYRPPPSLWHLIQIRNPRCTAPGCRLPAARCDDDHTLAYDKGGRTCECNLGPLCRHHHRVKQSHGWRLTQPEPGIYTWTTPSGWQYTTGPHNYAA